MGVGHESIKINLRDALMNTVSRLIAAAALSAASLSAHAELQARPGGMVYDTVQNITWLADFNYAKTSGYDADGRMGWLSARNWAGALVYGGFDDWRLPSALGANGAGPCGGYNCANSEMGHLFYVDLGGRAGSPYSQGSNAANISLFINVESVVSYWSGTEYAPNSFQSWKFSFNHGWQDWVGQQDAHVAVAVRAGDVLSAVPEPQATAMLLAGLGMLAALGRRRQR